MRGAGTGPIDMSQPSRKRGEASGSRSGERGGKKPRIDPVPDRVLRRKPLKLTEEAFKAKKKGAVRVAARCESVTKQRHDARATTRGANTNCALEFSSSNDQELYYALTHGKLWDIKRLVEDGAQIDFQRSFSNSTPLHLTARHDCSDIAMLLIEKKCNINITDKLGRTPLMWAVGYKNMAVVRTLVEAGADITIRCEDDETAAEKAREEGHHAIAEYLDHAIRFLPSAHDASGQLHPIKGRSQRAIERNLKEIANFDDHMLHRLKHFCVGK